MRLASFGAGVGLVAVAIAAACAGGTVAETTGDGGSGAVGATGGLGGGGGDGGTGGDGDLCALDCSAIMAPPCLVSVCNEGQYVGAVGQCVIVDAEDGTACEDGAFCTANDTCVAGDCTPGPQNDCGMDPGACQIVTCNESTQECTLQPGMNGTFCTPTDQCLVNATCQNGSCSGGQPKDCFFAPVPNECYVAVCNPMNGQCEPQPDPTKNGLGCVDQNDLCTVGKTCNNGNCIGGTPKDCSALTVGCFNGVCDVASGNCIQNPVPPGGMCAQATDDCNNGICDMQGNCNPVPTNQGGVCDDNDGCTNGTTCNNGQCAGGSVISQCALNDNCCPPGCSDPQDNDCIDLTNVWASYTFAGRNVHIWKTPVPCAPLANYVTFCQDHGLTWWSPKSQADAQQLIDFAFGLDMTVTWVQVYGLTTGLGTIGGYPVTVDGPTCCDGHPGTDWAAFRKWACSFCEPATGDCPSIGPQNTGNESCCWDKGNPYDWFACED
jgi:hypothetical protein